jgi:1-acyl-sn-glycerol-3-phosphate acyltransferase
MARRDPAAHAVTLRTRGQPGSPRDVADGRVLPPQPVHGARPRSLEAAPPGYDVLPNLAQRSPLLVWLFGWYLRWYFYRAFHAVRIARDGMPPSVGHRPVILYCNHPSWWDPATLLLLRAKLFPTRSGYGPIDAKALGQYGLLARMGAFGVPQDGKAGPAIFLRTSLAVLKQPGAILVVTAEGRFTDARTRPVTLRPGLAHVARLVPDAVILPLALEYPFWTESKPEALLRFGAPVQAPAGNDITAWTRALEVVLTETMDALAAQSVNRDPGLFQTLQGGGAGVGGIYDLWRRLRAAMAGRRFDPSHEGES